MAQLDIEQVEGTFLKDNAPRACGMGAPPSQLCGTLRLHPPPHPKDPQTPSHLLHGKSQLGPLSELPAGYGRQMQVT